MRFLSPILSLLIALALVAGFAISPAGAQDKASDEATATADTREIALREWYSNLPKHRQVELRKRLKTLKRLPKDRQQQILQAAKDGRPVLTVKQRENIQKLRKLSYLQRIRLYTTAAELNSLSRGPQSEEFQTAMKLQGRQRVMKLRGMMQGQRHRMFMNNLSDAQKLELRKMPEDKRRQALRRMVEKESKSRLAALESFYPRLEELKQAAKGGDKKSAKELRRMYQDLRTLDMLLQRLTPEKRRAMMSELRELSIEDAANTVRKALKDQWQDERKRNGKKKDRRPDRKPERDGKRGPEQRRKKPREQ